MLKVWFNAVFSFEWGFSENFFVKWSRVDVEEKKIDTVWLGSLHFVAQLDIDVTHQRTVYYVSGYNLK